MVAVHIERKVGAEIVRYPVLVAIRVIDPLRTAKLESGNRKGDGPSCTIDRVNRQAVTVGEAIVADKVCAIGPVKIGGIIISFIDGLTSQWIVLF